MLFADHVSRLEPGHAYAFQMRDRAGSVQRRRFLGCALSVDNIACLQVERANGKMHLISFDAIAAAVPVGLPE